ncbi:thioredoxin [Candidatus Shapirobacteria bacterium]|nr:thioredoxin [Candidatus Shapirobacteria bacterium]HQI12973.1 thioredoxin [Candidatus Woesebacteria bacterium]
MATNLDNSNFDREIINFSGTALVDFWAPWCGPCTMLSPIIDEIEAEIKDLKVARVNVDENSDLASKFNISSIPCVLIFKEGRLIDTLIGFRQKREYLDAIK